MQLVQSKSCDLRTDPRPQYFRLLEFYVVIDGIMNFIPLVCSWFASLPLFTFPISRLRRQLPPKCLQITSNCWIVVNVHPAPCENHELVALRLLITLNISAD